MVARVLLWGLAAQLLLDRSAALAHVRTITHFSVDGRQVDAIVPACASATSPIVLSLHAWGSSKADQRATDRLPTYMGAECPVLIYPQGKIRGALFGAVGWSWNAGGCCPNGNSDHLDDVGFLQRVISYAASHFHISADLVFVVGLSNGGMMANRLACTDDRIKAFVAVSGPLINGTAGSDLTETFECHRSVPVLHFHGLADESIPFDGCNTTFGGVACESVEKLLGGKMAAMPRVLDYIADWRLRNGVSEAPARPTFENNTCSCQSWGEATNNVTLCTLKDEGHAWPGSCRLSNMLPMFRCSMDIDASQQAMDFFRRYIPTTAGILVSQTFGRKRASRIR